MSLSTPRKTYGQGTRHEVLNRAIRAECPQGDACLDTIRALNTRIATLRSAGEDTAKAEERLRYWEGVRAELAAQLEVKHQVGPNTNRRRRAPNDRNEA